MSNRVQKIKDQSETSDWRYVPTEENPADYTSRGLSAKELLLPGWFQGPKFLWEANIDCRVNQKLHKELSPADPEVKHTAFQIATKEELPSIIERFSKYSKWKKLVTAVATLQTLIRRRTNKTELDRVSTKTYAETFIIKQLQKWYFPKEIQKATSDEQVTNASKIES